MTIHPTTSSTTDVQAGLEIIEIRDDLRFSRATLEAILPDVETALFFGKVFELDYRQLSHLLSVVLKSDLAQELQRGDHSTELQHYIVEDWLVPSSVNLGDVTFGATVPKGEILPELWRSLEIEVADSIKAVGNKIKSVAGLMPGKQGSMVFNAMMKMNVRRPTIGDYRARIHHAPVKENLVLFDVSGSMTRGTVETIVDDVVSMSYMANAHLAVVSNTTTHWEPGSFSVADVLRAAEFGGTHYETLAPLLNRQDWGVVVTVADYDSSDSAAQNLIRKVTTRLDQVLDISLVNKPTFLAEAIGPFADEVRPLLIAAAQYSRPMQA